MLQTEVGTATHLSDKRNFTLTYTITVTQNDNGQISPGTTTVDYGDTPTFTITPDTGYHIASITVNGEPVTVTNPAGQEYQFSAVSVDDSISATFAINTFSITVSQGDHGTISPETTSVNYGAGQEFTFTPATGYHIVAILVNGTTVGATSPYTVSDVTGATSLTAEYAIDVFTVTVGDHTHGSISSTNGTSVNYGDGLSFSVTPDAGYHLVSVLIDGQPATAPYNFINVIANGHTISATFAIDTFTITVTQGANGLITGSSSANYGADASYTIAPSTGYHIVNVIVDGVSKGATASYTISNVYATHTVTASFAVNIDAITATVTTTGDTYSVGISGNVTAQQMSNVTITPYQSNTTTIVSFTVTGPSGTSGFGNMTLPKTSIPTGQTQSYT
jgi:hypothetical protein